MGMKRMDVEWAVGGEHKVKFSRIGGVFKDRVEVRLDDEIIHTAVGLSGSFGRAPFEIDGVEHEVRYAYPWWSGDPRSIVLVQGDNVLEVHGTEHAASPDARSKVAIAYSILILAGLATGVGMFLVFFYGFGS